LKGVYTADNQELTPSGDIPTVMYPWKLPSARRLEDLLLWHIDDQVYLQG
jgi:hypothetical protein